MNIYKSTIAQVQEPDLFTVAQRYEHETKEIEVDVEFALGVLQDTAENDYLDKDELRLRDILQRAAAKGADTVQFI